MTYQLGVDLGTTYSSAAVLRAERVELASLGHRSPLVPSAVWLGPDGERLLGDAALRRGQRQPQRLAREFKRRFGDSVPLIIGGSPVSADQLTAMLLAGIVGQVTEGEGGPPDKIAVTHPANWGPYRREILTEAVRTAGFGDAILLTEPEAAALYYASTGRVADGEVVVVYDLGGGTFDVAVLQRRGDRFTLLGPPDGVERLGGIDFDAAVFDHVRRWVDEVERPAGDDDPWRAAVRRLYDDCVEAKEALSSDVVAEISVMLPARHVEVRLVRSEFEEMIRPALTLTVAAVRRALEAARVAPEDVARVLLVGGSSRIPLVAALVGSELGRDVSVDVHPKFAVALGAAMAAGTGGFIDDRLHVAGSLALDPARGRLTAVRAVAPPPSRSPSPAPAVAPESAPTPPEPAAPAPAGPEPDGPRPGRRWSVVGALGVAAVAVIAAVVAVVLVSDGGNGGDAAATTPAAVTTTVPPTRVATLGGTPSGLGAGFGAAWTATAEGELLQLDPVTGAVATRIDLGEGLDDVVAGTDRMWVTSGAALHSVDPDSLAPGPRIAMDGPPDALAASAEGIWIGVARPDGTGALHLLDEDTGALTLVTTLPGPVHEIVAADGLVWMTMGSGVHRFDRATGERHDIDVGPDPQGLAVAYGTVWLTVPGENRVVRLDPVTGAVVGDIATGASPDELIAGDGVMWITESGDGTVVAVDPATDEVVDRYEVGAAPDRLVWTPPNLLVANVGDGTLSIVPQPR